MVPENITRFIAEYDHNSSDRICFAWNQKHGAEFGDSNCLFRRQVIEAVLANSGQARFDLLRDLFEAEARWSKEAWSVGNYFPSLGELVLHRGGDGSLEHFVAWFANSFDAWCACHTMSLDRVTCDSLLEKVEQRLIAATDAAQKAKLELARDLFVKHKKGNPAQGLICVGPDTQIKNVRVVSRLKAWLSRISDFFRGR
jgi:hypothetical protein